jgi:diguanylate cyclase (GGDEF)-like protein
MIKFLLVEDSPIVVKIIKHLIREESELACDVANSFAEARTALANNQGEPYFAALVDLNLPDAPDGEVVDFMVEQKIPTIVLTGNFDEQKRQEMQHKKIVDYIVKESRFSYEYAIKLLHRLRKNSSIKILVTDDSKMSRNFISNLLASHLYHIVQADDGDTALEILNKDPDIKMLITDYNMPRMNGFDLVRQIRKEVSKNDLVIIGLSGEGDSALSAKFIKNGANDFLKKPFSNEEFHCRVMHNIENMEFLQTMRHMAYHDHATQLPNKRYFFEEGKKLLSAIDANSGQACIALISVDELDKLQDEHGIEISDSLVREIASILPRAFGRFHYARVGDGEVAILLSGLSLVQARKLLEGFLELVEDLIVIHDDTTLRFTASIGLQSNSGGGLMQHFKEADNHLFSARKNGGSQIVSET